MSMPIELMNQINKDSDIDNGNIQSLSELPWNELSNQVITSDHFELLGGLLELEINSSLIHKNDKDNPKKYKIGYIKKFVSLSNRNRSSGRTSAFVWESVYDVGDYLKYVASFDITITNNIYCDINYTTEYAHKKSTTELAATSITIRTGAGTGGLPIYGFYKKGTMWYVALEAKNNPFSNYAWIELDVIETLELNELEIEVKKEVDNQQQNPPPEPAAADDSTRDYTKTLEYQMQEEFTNPNYEELADYYHALYGKWDTFSMQSFNAVIGLPFNFMKNVDPCVGSSPYGKQYIEDILYDMPIALLRPGGPYLNSGLFDNGGSGLINFIKTGISYYGEYMKGSGFKEMLLGKDEKFTFYGSNGKAIEEGVSYSDLESKSNSGESDLGILEQMMLNIFVGKYTRFYTFMADFTKYTQYVNTLCHLFIHFLGIGNMYYIRADGQAALYAYYQDTWEQGETDKGNTLKHLFGPNHAIYAYYQPESNLSQVYSNTMRPTALESTLTSASDISKDAHFFLSSTKIDDLSMDLSKALNAVGSNGSGILGRLFGNVAEGAATILAGNNLDLPEVWADSQAQTTHTLTFRLTSPYGDRESIFLYVLRPLARLLAMSLPRQFGPNSYTSPFLVQAFSKGQFNIQCGVVTSLSVKRCGNGGESHTIMNIPTDLEVTMEIQDMYELVTLSNEYAGLGTWNGAFDWLGDKISANINVFGTIQATKLMFNNIGLMDFCAAYCGMNMNMPEQDMMMTLLFDVFKNRKADTVGEGVIGVTGVKSPSWTRQLQDNYYNAVGKNQTFITG